MLRIFLVDDNATVRTALRALLERQDEWTVVGEAGSGKDALKKFADHRPHVTVMDYWMPEMDGLEASRHLREQDPNASILLVTADPTIELQREVRKTGLNGFCPKDTIACLITAIKALARGKTHFHFREPAQGVA